MFVNWKNVLGNMNHRKTCINIICYQVLYYILIKMIFHFKSMLNIILYIFKLLFNLQRKYLIWISRFKVGHSWISWYICVYVTTNWLYFLDMILFLLFTSDPSTASHTSIFLWDFPFFRQFPFPCLWIFEYRITIKTIFSDMICELYISPIWY